MIHEFDMQNMTLLVNSSNYVLAKFLNPAPSIVKGNHANFMLHHKKILFMRKEEPVKNGIQFVFEGNFSIWQAYPYNLKIKTKDQSRGRRKQHQSRDQTMPLGTNSNP